MFRAKTNSYHIHFLKVIFLLGFAACIPSASPAQLNTGSGGAAHQDTLRGTIGPERAWWNVTRYDVEVTPDYQKKTIFGSSLLTATAVKPGTIFQLDLQEPMILDSVIQIGTTRTSLKYVREGNAFHVSFPSEYKEKSFIVKAYFHGKPREAKMPPWDGGWIWKKDQSGAPWMSVACQGLGASVWFPCKDHQSDEPENGASLKMNVPDSLIAVANGRLIAQSKEKKLASFTWEVKNPINIYNLVPYIGKYSHFSEPYNGEKGKLDCDFWVLTENLEKAKTQFTQAAKMLKCFEYWFGPYPFYEDGYKLVESPHLGMEHQSAVAYGNKFQNGYLGRDLSGSGWGLKWDFIIVHESGHEWFANNITSNDIADMWIHEGFTAYSETIYTTCEFGVQAGNEYVIGTRQNMENDKPVIGQYGVNKQGSGDMYYKGANMLHTIRQIIDNDEKFRKILRGLNSTFYHKTIDTKDIENYINKEAGKNFSKIFDQYLRTIKIPVLEYAIDKSSVTYRWTNCVKGFNMPVKIVANGKTEWISPSDEWKTGKLAPELAAGLTVDPNFYVTAKKVDIKSIY